MQATTQFAKQLMLLAVAFALTACGDGSGSAPTVLPSPPPPPPPPPATFTVGGAVSGLTGSGLVLQNNGGDNLAVSGNGAATFATALTNNTAYSVTVSTQPSNPSQSCAVTSGSGMINGANVANVSVTCTNVSPLTAPELSLTLQSVKTFHFTWPDVNGETGYRLLENPDGVSGFAQIATIDANATSFDLVASLTKLANARYILQACNAGGCADSSPVFVLAKTSGPPALDAAIGYFKASNAGGGFGFSVALSADGNTMAIGAHAEDGKSSGIDGDQTPDTQNASNSGAVYVFVRSASNAWIQQAYVKASTNRAEDHFGYSVALSNDGSTMVVGAPFEDSGATGTNGSQGGNSKPDSGAAYVFYRTGTTWVQAAYVKATNPDIGDSFGYSVAVSGDGNTFAFGAIDEDSAATGINGNQLDNSALNSGAIYVYSRSGGSLAQQAYVKASNTDTAIGATDIFGESVALSNDGNTVVVGASGEDGASNATPNAGAAYVFTRSGTVWTQQSYLKGSNTAAADHLGVTVSISGDGDTVAVGATGEDGGTIVDSGAVYVFTRSGVSWTQQQRLKASNPDLSDVFGTAISLSNDGNTIAIGASGEDSNATGIDGVAANEAAVGSGAAYVFTRTAGAWSQRAYVKASNTDPGDSFGFKGIALSSDGSALAVGAFLEESTATGIGGDQSLNNGGASGAVYLY